MNQIRAMAQLAFPAVLTAMACLWTVSAKLHAQTQTPFVAFVSAQGARMHCGPGKEYYATGNVRPGMEVTVHRRAPGGWLGIRPPQDSFCWVPNADLQVSSDGATAKVVRDGVVPWIAAMGGHAPNRWQIRLHIGESVRLIGSPERLPLNGGPARWWRRIAPPSGEFRWIRESDLAEPPGRIVVADEPLPSSSGAAPTKNIFQTVSHNKDSSGMGKTSVRFGESTKSSKGGPSAQAKHSGDPAQAEDAQFAGLDRMERAAKRLEDAFDQLDALVKPAQFREWRKRGSGESELAPNTTPPRQPDDVPFRDRKRSRQQTSIAPKRKAEREEGEEPPLLAEKLTKAEFHRELVRLDADLSLMVSKPISSWRLSGLKKRAIALSQSGPSALDRGRAALLLDSIHGFDQLHVRSLAAEEDVRSRREIAEQDEPRERRGARAVSNANRTYRERPATRQLDPKDAGDNSPEEQDEALDEDPMEIRKPLGSGLRRGAQLGEPEELPAPELLDRTVDGLPNYDARGVLKRVTSERRIAPPYALVDNNGDIVTLVAPAKGLNLQTYLGKSIGVFGPQRKLPSFKRNLLTAQRVVRMDRIR